MPNLTLLAGPNGAGKTSFSGYLLDVGLIATQPVNIDALEIFIDTNRIPDDPLRYEREKSKEIDRVFTQLCKEAIDAGHDFSYECNLRNDQLKNVSLFDQAGYSLSLFYFWLDDVSVSIDRVKEREKQGGNRVGEQTIRANFRIGLENLDGSFKDWSKVLIFDNTPSMEKNTGTETLPILLYVCEGKIEYVALQFYEKKGIRKKMPLLMEEVDRFGSSR